MPHLFGRARCARLGRQARGLSGPVRSDPVQSGPIRCDAAASIGARTPISFERRLLIGRGPRSAAARAPPRPSGPGGRQPGAGPPSAARRRARRRPRRVYTTARMCKVGPPNCIGAAPARGRAPSARRAPSRPGPLRGARAAPPQPTRPAPCRANARSTRTAKASRSSAAAALKPDVALPNRIDQNPCLAAGAHNPGISNVVAKPCVTLTVEPALAACGAMRRLGVWPCKSSLGDERRRLASQGCELDFAAANAVPSQPRKLRHSSGRAGC